MLGLAGLGLYLLRMTNPSKPLDSQSVPSSSLKVSTGERRPTAGPRQEAAKYEAQSMWEWSLSVKVLDATDSSPVPTARVSVLSGEEELGPQFAGQDGAQFRGESELEVLTLKVAVARRRPSNVAVSRESQLSRDRPADEISVLLPKGETIRIDVVDSLGSPIEQAWVQLDGKATGDTDQPAPWKHGGYTSAGGDLKFAGLALELIDAVWASHERFGSKEVKTSDLATTLRHGLRIVLGSEGRVSGSVLDTDGRPSSGASLLFRIETTVEQLPVSVSVPGRTTTDAAGRFDLPLAILPGDRVRVSAQAPGFQPSTSDEYAVPDSRALVGIQLTLSPGASIHGIVTARDGSPMAGRVHALSVKGKGGRLIPPVELDATGEFLIDSLVPGEAYKLEGLLRVNGEGGGRLLPYDLGTITPQTNTIRLSLDPRK